MERKPKADIKGQQSIFDFMPEIMPEPGIGEIIEKAGAAIPHIMRPGYIGRKVCYDCSTQSKKGYRVGILEAVNEAFYYSLESEDYKRIPCDRVTIFTGKRQRSFILMMPGSEIFECLPVKAYQKRNEAIERNRCRTAVK